MRLSKFAPTLGIALALVSIACVKKKTVSDPESFKDNKTGVVIFEELMLPTAMATDSDARTREFSNTLVGAFGVCYYQQTTGQDKGTRINLKPVPLYKAFLAAEEVINQGATNNVTLVEDFNSMLEALAAEAKNVDQNFATTYSENTQNKQLNLIVGNQAALQHLVNTGRTIATPQGAQKFISLFTSLLKRVGKAPSRVGQIWKDLIGAPATLRTTIGEAAKSRMPQVKLGMLNPTGWFSKDSGLQQFWRSIWQRRDQTPPTLGGDTQSGINPMGIFSHVMTFLSVAQFFNMPDGRQITSSDIEKMSDTEFEIFLTRANASAQKLNTVLSDTTPSGEGTAKTPAEIYGELAARLEVFLKNKIYDVDGKGQSLISAFEELGKNPDPLYTFAGDCNPEATPVTSPEIVHVPDPERRTPQ